MGDKRKRRKNKKYIPLIKEENKPLFIKILFPLPD
jgi:hypothetical protein